MEDKREGDACVSECCTDAGSVKSAVNTTTSRCSSRVVLLPALLSQRVQPGTRRRCCADGSHRARARAGMFVLLLDGSLMPDCDDEEDEEKEGEDEQPDNEPEDDVWVEQAVLALALSRRCSRFPIVTCHSVMHYRYNLDLAHSIS